MSVFTFRFSEAATHRIDEMKFLLKVRDRSDVLRIALRDLDVRLKEGTVEVSEEEEPDTPKEWVVKYGPWEVSYFCSHCDEEVSETTVYSTAVCPHCGDHDGVKVGDVTQRARRQVYTYIPKWWEWLFYGKRSCWHWEYLPEPPEE